MVGTKLEVRHMGPCAELKKHRWLRRKLSVPELGRIPAPLMPCKVREFHESVKGKYPAEYVLIGATKMRDGRPITC